MAAAVKVVAAAASAAGVVDGAVTRRGDVWGDVLGRGGCCGCGWSAQEVSLLRCTPAAPAMFWVVVAGGGGGGAVTRRPQGIESHVSPSIDHVHQIQRVSLRVPVVSTQFDSTVCSQFDSNAEVDDPVRDIIQGFFEVISSDGQTNILSNFRIFGWVDNKELYDGIQKLRGEAELAERIALLCN